MRKDEAKIPPKNCPTPPLPQDITRQRYIAPGRTRLRGFRGRSQPPEKNKGGWNAGRNQPPEKNSLRLVQNQLIFIQEGRASGVGGGGSGWKQLFQDPAVNQRRVLHRVHGRFFR